MSRYGQAHAALVRVWKWADNHADIKDSGYANDAMIVKDMIEDELGGAPESSFVGHDSFRRTSIAEYLADEEFALDPWELPFHLHILRYSASVSVYVKYGYEGRAQFHAEFTATIAFLMFPELREGK